MGKHRKNKNSNGNGNQHQNVTGPYGKQNRHGNNKSRNGNVNNNQNWNNNNQNNYKNKKWQNNNQQQKDTNQNHKNKKWQTYTDADGDVIMGGLYRTDEQVQNPNLITINGLNFATAEDPAHYIRFVTLKQSLDSLGKDFQEKINSANNDLATIYTHLTREGAQRMAFSQQPVGSFAPTVPAMAPGSINTNASSSSSDKPSLFGDRLSSLFGNVGSSFNSSSGSGGGQFGGSNDSLFGNLSADSSSGNPGFNPLCNTGNNTAFAFDADGKARLAPGIHNFGGFNPANSSTASGGFGGHDSGMGGGIA